MTPQEREAELSATTEQEKTAAPVTVDVAVDRERLAAALRSVTAVIAARPGLPVLAGAHLAADSQTQTVTAAATDYETWITRRVPAEVTTGGETLVSGREALAMVKKLPKRAPVRITATATQVSLTDGEVVYRLRTLPTADYPAAPQPAGGVVARPPGGALADMARVATAAGRDPALPQLATVHLHTRGGRLAAMATDRYRVAVCRTHTTADFGETGGVSIPTRVLATVASEFKHAEEAAVTVATERFGETTQAVAVAVSNGATSVVARPEPGDFPTLDGVWPREFATTVAVDRKALATAVDQVQVAAERGTPVRMSTQPQGVALAAGTGDEASAEKHLPARVTGQHRQAALRPTYLTDGLAFLGGTETRIRFTTATKPALLDNPDNPELEYLLMPVNLDGFSQ